MNTKERVESLGHDLKNASRSLWLAGLGAASSVETGGRKLFEQMVDKGRKLGSHPSRALPLGEPLRQAGQKVKDLGQRVEQRIESGMTETLHRFGVPAKNDFQILIDRIEKLTLKVEALAKN